jgi:flavin reductase (DIM6/NTAB) family NADH-FMN oxidoreductase RutF
MNYRRFRNALGQFPTGVVVATARTVAGQLIGMTMSSFNSVSLDPPLVLFSLLRQARGFALWQTVEWYAINVLNVDQEQISNQFVRATGDKWGWHFPANGRYRCPNASERGGRFRMSGSRAV